MFLWYTFLFINKSFCQLLVPKIIQIQKNWLKKNLYILVAYPFFWG
jgi:hypothetical protein